MMSLVAQILHSKKIIKEDIKVKEVQFRKYIRTRNPIEELEPIKSKDDFTHDSIIFTSIKLESDGINQVLTGYFRVNEKGEFEPQFTDEDEIEIHPDDVSDGKLTEKAIETIKKHKDRLWDIAILILNILISR
jgi:uncharacterized membrane protein YcjF (UPF0283 family)